jgi:hypothetical protein
MAKKAVQKFQMALHVPANGEIEVKLTNKFALGTLTVTSKGIRYDGVKAKIKSERMLTWDNLKALAKSGLI